MTGISRPQTTWICHLISTQGVHFPEIIPDQCLKNGGYVWVGGWVGGGGGYTDLYWCYNNMKICDCNNRNRIVMFL